MADQRLLAIYPVPGNGPSLASLADSLLEQQLRSWKMLAAGYEGLGEARLREIRPGLLSAFLQFNRKRMASTGAKVDPASVAARACFLCLHNLPDDQRAVLYRDDYLLLCNPAPILDHHFTIPHTNHIPQAIAGALETFFALITDFSPGYTVFYNGPKCGASAPDHLHFQASPSGAIPVETQFRTTEARGLSREVRGGTVTVFGLPERSAVVLEGPSPDITRSLLDHLLATARKKSGTAEEPMVNLLGWMRDGACVAIVFLRSKHRPAAYFLEGEDRIVVSPAAVDMGGLIVTPREKDFRRIDEARAGAIYKEVSIGGEELNGLVEAL